MSFNSFLLAKFGPKKLLNTKATSFALRYQTLFIIYLNFTFVFCVACFEVFSWSIGMLPRIHLLSGACLAAMICSIVFLKRGYHNAAGAIILIYIHTSNFVIGYFFNGSFAAMFGVFSYLNASFFLTSSTKVLFLNNLVCALQMFIHVKKLLKVFEVTLLEEQYTQILSGISFISTGFVTLCVLNLTQKNVEGRLWKLVEENYEKSGNLTKEVIQAMEAKDHFVSSLSHEVRNALSSLNGSVDYLLTVLKDSAYLNVLKNAQLKESTQNKNIDIYFVSGDYFNKEEVMARLKTVDGNKGVTGFKFLRKPVEVEMIANIVKRFQQQLEQAQPNGGGSLPSPLLKYKMKLF